MYMAHCIAPGARYRTQGIGRGGVQNSGYRQRWGARQFTAVVGILGIVSKHDYALPAQYPKHSNAQGVSLRLESGLA